jgi:hypothetical protein
LVKLVTTKYVLVVSDLSRFLPLYANLDRLVYVMENFRNVKLIGTSFRDEHGRWKYGCYQIESLQKWSNLHIFEGYKRSSRFDTIYCDTLNSAVPFITLTRLLQEEINFDETLDNTLMFQDLFRQFQKKGYLINSQPDSMFFLNLSDVNKQLDSYFYQLNDKDKKHQREMMKIYAAKWKIKSIKFNSIYFENKDLFLSF